jgi:hypothetical protein
LRAAGPYVAAGSQPFLTPVTNANANIAVADVSAQF